MDKKNLYNHGYSFEEECWIERLGSKIDELIEQQDDSESYEMDVKHLFRLENGNFAVITEYGCSCYEPMDACITVFNKKDEAEKRYRLECDG